MELRDFGCLTSAPNLLLPLSLAPPPLDTPLVFLVDCDDDSEQSDLVLMGDAGQMKDGDCFSTPSVAVSGRFFLHNNHYHM